MVVYGSVDITLALQSPFVEVRRYRGDGGAAEVLLVQGVWEEEVVLAAFLDKPVSLVHRVIGLEQGGGEVGGGHRHHVLNPGAVRPVVHELDVKLFGDPVMSRVMIFMMISMMILMMIMMITHL